MKFVFILILIVSSSAFSDDIQSSGGSSTGANQSSNTEQIVDYSLGGASMAAGVVLMAKGCAPTPTWKCYLGAGLVMSGMMDITQAAGRSGAMNDTVGGSGTGNGSSGPPTAPTTALPPAAQGYLDTANQIAAQTGQPLSSLASQGGGGGGGGGVGGIPADLPPDVKDAVDKAIKDANSKFRVSAVALEGGGGGARPGSSNSDNIDLKGLLDSLKDRKPSGVSGLQKSFNGEPIGVSNDNIFAQVSRRYKAKVDLQSFLPPAK